MGKKQRVTSRKIARFRYEQRCTREKFVGTLFIAVMNVMREGRATLDVEYEVLKLALSDVEDRLAEHSPSWVDDPVTATWSEPGPNQKFNQ